MLTIDNVQEIRNALLNGENYEYQNDVHQNHDCEVYAVSVFDGNNVYCYKVKAIYAEKDLKYLNFQRVDRIDTLLKLAVTKSIIQDDPLFITYLIMPKYDDSYTIAQVMFDNTLYVLFVEDYQLKLEPYESFVNRVINNT